MNRATRDKFAARTQSDTAPNACWETDPAVFRKLNEDFGPFDVDLTADVHRALCSTWFGPGSLLMEDALSGGWGRFGLRGYSNPPYGSFVPKLLTVAAAQAEAGFESTILLPMRVTRAFHSMVLGRASELLFCDRRLVFYENGLPRMNPKTGKADCAMFDSIIVRYQWPVRRPDVPLRVGSWRVPVEVAVSSF